MRRPGTPPSLIIAASLLAMFGLIAVGAFLWGPLHETYERVCLLYPPLRSVGPLPFTLAITAGLASAALGLGSLVSGVIRSVRLSHGIQASQIESPTLLLQAASSLNLEGRVVCIEGSHPLAFCYGLFKPMVCVSRSLVDYLDSRELGAVLAHEREHLGAKDPLRLLCGKALSRAFFMIPLAGEIYRRYVLRRELRADEKCIAVYEWEPLASALLKLSATDTRTPAGAAGFNLLEKRIQYLTESERKANFNIPWTRITGQAMVATGLLFLGFVILGGTVEAAVVGCLL